MVVVSIPGKLKSWPYNTHITSDKDNILKMRISNAAYIYFWRFFFIFLYHGKVDNYFQQHLLVVSIAVRRHGAVQCVEYNQFTLSLGLQRKAFTFKTKKARNKAPLSTENAHNPKMMWQERLTFSCANRQKDMTEGVDYNAPHATVKASLKAVT